jgi:hypothetical protein
MKQWTQHQPRTNQLLETDQFNAEQLAHRGSIASLNRSQLPAIASETQFVDGALCKTYLTKVEQQTELQDTNVSSDQWRCPTTDNYSGEDINCIRTELTDHKGGMTYVEWMGMGFCNAFSCMQGAPGSLGAEKPMEKQLKLRVTVNGIVVAESEGLQQGVESFRVFGTVFLPPGDHLVEATVVGFPAGDEDPLETSSGPGTPVHIMLYHVINMELFALARYR